MNEQMWIKQEYNTWDEAFRGLCPAVRQQSVRVAAYTQVLFNQACQQGFGADMPMGAEYIRGQHAEVAYKCGMYHQLGKSLVPPEYQLWRSDFSEEEIAVYRKYTTDGRTLVALLQDRSVRAKEKRSGERVEQPTKNIPDLMIRETCQQHMERWDGSGFPAGLAGMNISPIAQIVGLAYELDRLSAQTKSEKPFDEAMALLLQQGGKAWSPELITVLKAAQGKCRDVYNKYIQYTMTLPTTIPLVKKNKDRTLGLKFRPMVADGNGTVVAYEAIPWFGGIADRPGETETMEEVAETLRRTDLIEDVSFYFLYEAADAVLRMQNCKLGLKGVLLQLLPDFYLQGSKMQRLKQLFNDQPIAREQLMLTVPAQILKNGSKELRETLQRYLRNGICLVLDQYNPEEIPVQQLTELGFSHLRIDPALYVQEKTAKLIAQLRQQGFTLLGSGVNDHNTMAWLAACDVTCFSGSLTGIAVTEDEMIRDCLLREQ